MENSTLFKKFIDGNDTDEQCFQTEKTYLGKSWWYVKDLVGLEGVEYDLDLMSIDLGVMPWKLNNMIDIIGHIHDANKADFDYPVIVAPAGWVMNGWHRIAKAILEGKKTIKAKRLIELPDEAGKDS